MEFPTALLYTAEHEWIRIDGDIATIGITDFAQDALGDVVYVAPAEVGDAVSIGANVAEVESTKSVSEIYAPLSGTIAERNVALDDAPELINQQPYGDGWILKLQLSDTAEVDALLSAEAYTNLVS
jgi:glycine cleavage system H protein